MFTRRRQRRRLTEAIAAELTCVSTVASDAIAAAGREITMTELTLRGFPRAAAGCSGCGG